MRTEVRMGRGHMTDAAAIMSHPIDGRQKYPY
jgi:hypothetical protein